MNEQHKRSIAKAISWRIIASLTTTIIVFMLTKELALSLGAGMIDMAIKLVFYYFHERAWDGIKWGRTNKKI